MVPTVCAACEQTGILWQELWQSVTSLGEDVWQAGNSLFTTLVITLMVLNNYVSLNLVFGQVCVAFGESKVHAAILNMLSI